MTFVSEIVPCFLFAELFTNTSLVYECITSLHYELPAVMFLKQGSTAFPVVPVEEAEAKKTSRPSAASEL